MTLRNLNLCRGQDRGYRDLMSRMLGRVMGPLVVLVVALAATPAASAEPGGGIAGWRSPAGGPPMDILVQATPDPQTEAALSSATATLADLVVTESFADGTCSQTCPAIVVLPVDTLARTDDGRRKVPDGDHWLVVTIEDVNGATKVIRQLITVDNKLVGGTDDSACEDPPPPGVLGRTCVDIPIGSGAISPQPSPPGPVRPDTTDPSCRAPRLSMRLAEKPLRYRRGVPVLLRNRAYRFAGRLTCRINGARRGAPRGMPVQVRHRLRGGWTVVKPSIQVRKAGEIVARLAFRSRRVVIFRVRGAAGDLVRVRVPIRVVRRR